MRIQERVASQRAPDVPVAHAFASTREGKIWQAWHEVLVAFGIFVLYHVVFGGILLLPFAASAYFGSLAWGVIRRQPVPLRESAGAVVALFFAGMFLLPLPAWFVRAWPVVVLSLVLSAFLCRWGAARLQRSSMVRDSFGTAALAFFAGVCFSAGVLIFRTITGALD